MYTGFGGRYTQSYVVEIDAESFNHSSVELYFEMWWTNGDLLVNVWVSYEGEELFKGAIRKLEAVTPPPVEEGLSIQEVISETLASVHEEMSLDFKDFEFEKDKLSLKIRYVKDGQGGMDIHIAHEDAKDVYLDLSVCNDSSEGDDDYLTLDTRSLLLEASSGDVIQYFASPTQTRSHFKVDF